MEAVLRAQVCYPILLAALRGLRAWPNSESRLMDIMERMCPDDDFTCLGLLEKSEKHIADFWNNVFDGPVRKPVRTFIFIPEI